ncbi:MAG TPA: ATP-binding protein [Candidatus Sulfomarinibacteraceae bacterium]|nr:ATP-binding protein [Candidatus Sulfomarinibacteraceae bacterium]
MTRTLAVSLLLVALVPFLPLGLLTWFGYLGDVERVEAEIRGANRHIAMLAGTYLDTLLRQVRDEARVAAELRPEVPPPPLTGVAWEIVAADGTVAATQLDPGRVGRPCGYAGVLGRRPGLTGVGAWLDGEPPTVLYLGPAAAAGRIVAVLRPAVLHGQLQAWTRQGLDRHLYVVDAGGSLLFYSDLELSQRGADLSGNPPIRAFVAGAAGDLRYVSMVSGKERLGFVHRMTEADWGVVVSADVGERLLGLQGRYRLLGWSIAFALVAAVAILLLTSRRLTRPLLDLRRALRDPDRAPHEPLEVASGTRRLAEVDDLVEAVNELGADLAAVERELVQAEKASLLGQLASGLAHEMGTPLNVITGNAQYLLRRGSLDHAQAQTLEQIVSQAQRIAAMIRRLLDVSRPAEARLTPVDLPAVIRQSLDIVPRVGRGVEIRCDLDDGIGPVLADPKLIEHALMNLIVNACQAMPDGGRLALVAGVESAVTTAGGPFVLLMVSDTGCGIPAENLPHLFEPFFTTKPHPEGTGLGLAIVERIVRQHGGRVDIVSTPGRGTVVLLRLRPVPPADGGRRRVRKEAP